MVDSSQSKLPRGVIFTATGDKFVRMATRAAESLKVVHPDLPIDLFTDAAGAKTEGPFAQITQLDNVWHRSKLDAMAQTRFEKTIFLDADLIVIAQIDDVFQTLERFDFAAAHDQEDNSQHGTRVWQQTLPASFPQFNSGVIGYRATSQVLGLLRKWSEVVRSEQHERDQPVLRELLWQSDLRVATLPAQYNFTQFQNLVLFRSHQITPRIIHGPNLRFLPQIENTDRVPKLVRNSVGGILKGMIGSDHYLANFENRKIKKLPGHQKRWLQLVALFGLSGRG